MRALILEDSPTKLKTIMELCEKVGLDTIVFGSYKGAQNYVRENRTDFYFLDSFVPMYEGSFQLISTGGLYIAREVRRFHKGNPPVIYFTSSDEFSCDQCLKESSDEGWVSYKFDFNDLDEIQKSITQLIGG